MFPLCHLFFVCDTVTEENGMCICEFFEIAEINEYGNTTNYLIDKINTPVPLIRKQIVNTDIITFLK